MAELDRPRPGRTLLDLLLPPRCLACGVEISAADGLCPPCWSELRLLAPPWCRCCGFPLPHAFADAPLCARLRAQPPGFDRARAALRYDARSSRIILGFKRGGRLDGVPLFARWMAQAGEELLADADLILPVPLHRWRLLTSRLQPVRRAGAAHRPPDRAALGAGAARAAPRDGVAAGAGRAAARRRTSPPAAFRVRAGPSASPGPGCC